MSSDVSYRVGGKVEGNVYRVDGPGHGGVYIGHFCRPEDAALAVAALNALSRTDEEEIRSEVEPC